MNTKQVSFFSLPITHILLLIAITMCATIIATLFHYMQMLTLLYAVGISIVLYKRNNFFIALALCLLTFSFVTVSRINQQFEQYNSDHIWLHKPVIIEGIVTSIQSSSLIKDQTTLTISTTSIQNNKKQSLTKKKNISLFVPSKQCLHITEFQSIKVFNIRLEQPYHESDYQRYLIKEGIWAAAHCNNNIIETTKEATSSLQRTYFDSISKRLSSTSLFNPLFLGKKEKSLQALDIQHRSVYWGAAHHMARSGVHLGVLFSLLMLFFHYASIAHWFRYILSVIMLLMYAYISFSSISFLRSLFMILLHIICKFFKKIPSTLHILTLVTITTLLYNPMQLLFLDFQLSFGITYILIWLFLMKNSKTIAFS